MNTTIINSEILNPLSDIGEGFLINKKLDYTICFKMRLPRIHSLTGLDFDAIVEKFSASINILSPGIIIQRTDFFYPAYPNIDTNNRSSIAYKNIKLLNGSKVMFSEHYIFFTKLAKPAEQTTLAKSLFQTLLNAAKGKNVKGLLDESHYDENKLNAFLSEIRSFIENLKASVEKNKGLDFIRLKKEEIEEVINRYKLLNLTNEVHSGESPDISDHKDRVRIGDNYLNIISMLSDGLPSNVSTCKLDEEYATVEGTLAISNMFELGYNIDFPHIVTQVIYTIDQTKVFNDIEKKRKIMIGAGNEVSSNRHNALNIAAVQNDVEATKTDKFVNYHLGIMIITPMQDESYYEDCINKVKGIFSNMKIKFSVNNGNTLGYYYAYYPGNAGDISDVDKNLCYSQHAATFGLYECNRDFKPTRGGLLVCERKTGYPYEIDFWIHPSITNKNMFIVGQSGSGKSVLQNAMVTSYLDHGDHVLLTDVGGSYVSLCEKYGGINLEFSQENPLKFNPFLIVVRNHLGFYSTVKDEDIEFITLLIYTAWQSANKTNTITSEVHATLSGIIKRYYEYLDEPAHLNIIPSFTNYYLFFKFTVENDTLYKSLQNDIFNRSSFFLVMSRFIEECTGEDGTKYKNGDLSVLFNPVANEDIFNNRFVIFELDKIKDNVILFPIAYFILTKVVVQQLLKAKKKGLRTYYIIDEAWILLGGKYGNVAYFIEYAFRTFRKHNGSVGIVTQDVLDISNNIEIGQAIEQNCDIKIFKRQSPEKYQIIQKNMNMSDLNMNLLFSMNDKYRDFFVKFKDEAVILKLHLSQYALGCFTTDPIDRKWINEDMKQTKSLEATLQNFEDFQTLKTN